MRCSRLRAWPASSFRRRRSRRRWAPTRRRSRCGVRRWREAATSSCRADRARWRIALVARFAFTHSIHQQVFYQRITSARRRRLHLAVGERGEAAYGARASEIASELAVHFEQARDLPRAIAYLRLAAGNATRRSANEEAIACLTRALALADLADEQSGPEVRIGLYEQLGLVLRSRGDVAVAAEQFVEMARLAGEAGRPEDEARAWLYAASVLSWFNRDRCLRAAERAERLTIVDPVLRAHVRGYAAYARLIFQGWRAEDADACAEAARGDAVRGREAAVRVPSGTAGARPCDAQRLRRVHRCRGRRPRPCRRRHGSVRLPDVPVLARLLEPPRRPVGRDAGGPQQRRSDHRAQRASPPGDSLHAGPRLAP